MLMLCVFLSYPDGGACYKLSLAIAGFVGSMERGNGGKGKHILKHRRTRDQFLCRETSVGGPFFASVVPLLLWADQPLPEFLEIAQEPYLVTAIGFKDEVSEGAALSQIGGDIA